MFLIARSPNTTSEIPFADVEQLAREQRISEPYYSGLTETGARIAISATSAKPVEDRLDAVDLLARVERTDGFIFALSAETGLIDRGGDIARLEGSTRIATSDGYRMETEALRADLASGAVFSDTEVFATGPFGELRAGAMEIEPERPTGGGRILFKDGVNLIYRPSSSQENRP
ncbi:hypothetical protein AADZ90_003420 [Aestuariibius sp. 2305UL40-4]|uniref:hypothetical protein n=1 Tax=Aestuariibius violaceus TaxID=3234132 RepID=UPI00348767D7